MGPNGYNEEEMKMVKETHKIWGQDDVAITATCIRVPIMRAHAESINLEFERDISEQEVRSSCHMCFAMVRQQGCYASRRSSLPLSIGQSTADALVDATIRTKHVI